MIGKGAYETAWEKGYRQRQRAEADRERGRWREAVRPVLPHLIPRSKNGYIGGDGYDPPMFPLPDRVTNRAKIAKRGVFGRRKDAWVSPSQDRVFADAVRQLEKDKPWMFDATWHGTGKYIRGIPVGDDVIRHRFTRLYKSDRPYARRLRAVQARIAARRLPPRVYDWSRRGPGGRRQRIVVRPVVNDSLALVPMTEAEIAASHDAWMREAYPYRYPVEQAMERGVARVGELIGEGSEAVGRIAGSVRGAVDRGVSAALSVFGRGGTFAEAQAAGEHAMVSGAADQSPGVLNSMQAALGAVVAAGAQKAYDANLGAAARQRVISRVADAASGAVAASLASRGALGAALSSAASAVTGAATSAVLQGVESGYGADMDAAAAAAIRRGGVQLGGREATPEDLAVLAGGVRVAGQVLDSLVRTPARQSARVGDVSSAVTVYSPDALRGGGGDTMQSALLDAATGGVTHLIGVGHDGDVPDLGAGGRLRPIDPNTPMRGQGRYRRVRWRR